jgi:hypothetical protein
MRSMITTIVLAMLSFTIVHDTFIHTMKENHEKIHVAHIDKPYTQSQECETIEEIHAMFHFMALISPYVATQPQAERQKTDTFYALRYTQTFQDTTYKPPQA